MDEYSWKAAVPGKTLPKRINLPQQFGGDRGPMVIVELPQGLSVQYKIDPQKS